MAKPKKMYVCQNCGYETTQWIGQCIKCKQWNTFVEEVIIQTIATSSLSKSKKARAKRPVQLSSVLSRPLERLSSGLSEFDRVLGGGFVPGQVVLLVGEPGIGKSTVLTSIAKSMEKSKILYICGEESIDQIKLRALRLKYKAENLLMLDDRNVHAIIATIETTKNVGLVIIDSIQALYSPEFSGTTGSIPQIKGCTHFLVRVAKDSGIPIVLVGHVTKQGTVAGPKVLEHMVDTVLQLEGDSQHLFRVLRTTKNRFGPVSEVGIFEMVEEGMREVTNPSELFLQHRMETAGSAITVIMEGYRPILFEIQALTVRTSFGYPKRTTSGLNTNRLQVLLATLERRAGLNLGSHDVYLNVAGGFKVKDYAADLAVCLAIASALKDKPLKEGTIVFGEVGLNGEIRRVPHMKNREREAKKLGYKTIISPTNTKDLRSAIRKALAN